MKRLLSAILTIVLVGLLVSAPLLAAGCATRGHEAGPGRKVVPPDRTDDDH